MTEIDPPKLEKTWNLLHRYSTGTNFPSLTVQKM